MKTGNALAVAQSAGSCGVILMLLAALAAACWVILDRQYCLGRVERTVAVPGRSETLASVNWAGDNRLVLLERDIGSRVSSWRTPMLIAKGTVSTVGNREMLTVSGSAAQVLPFPTLDDLKRAIHDFNEFLKQHREVAVLGGVLLAVVGFWAVRLVAAGALGLTLAGSVWFGLALSGLQGFLEVPHGTAALAALAALGFLVGCVVALRPETIVGRVAVRLTLALLCLAFAEGMSETLGWPVEVAALAGLAASLLVPPAGLVLLVAHMLVIGLDAYGVGVYIVLFLAVVSVHVLVGGRWVPMPAKRKPRRARSSARTFCLGINDLLSAGKSGNRLEARS